MYSNNNQAMIMSEDDENVLRPLAIPSGFIVGLTLKTALDLDIFTHMSKAGPGAKLSAEDIASYLPTQNPEAPIILDRILRLLASQSYLKCFVQVDNDGVEKRFFSLVPVCKAFVENDIGVDLSTLLKLIMDKTFIESWINLKDAILEGGTPFTRAHGMHFFEYIAKDSALNESFNKGMSNHSTIMINKTFEVYKGFEGLKEIIDVGGGVGTCIALIVSKYPNIKAINYDLPHVIKHAPIYPDVEHVVGDMFESVPETETIFMKWILHDWSDEHCLKILKNCWKALPESGKLIMIESVLPEYPEGDIISTINQYMDIGMMIINPGGKERTLKEFQALAKSAGFSSLKLICPVYNCWVIEIYKT